MTEERRSLARAPWRTVSSRRVYTNAVLLVGQYRYVMKKFAWEIPTGAAKPGESEIDAAQRELAEEAGYRAGRLEKICTVDTSKSILDATAHIYFAARRRGL
jgi:ADP-ribose pyrophosphatase